MTGTKPRLLLTLVAGFGVWAVCFVVIYAAQGLGCAYGWHAIAIGPLSLQRIILLGLALGGTLVTVLVARHLSRMRRAERQKGTAAFILTVAACAAYVSIPATIVTFSGVMLASICA